jgi:hypothetical protein
MSGAFFVLQQPFDDETYEVYGDPAWAMLFGRAEWAEGVELESIKCPIHPGHQRGGRRIGPLILKPSGRGLGDFNWTSLSECVITDRVRTLLTEAGFTGFETREVYIATSNRLTRRARAGPLWELVVTGLGGDADAKSGIRHLYTCRHCGMKRYSSFRNGILIDERSWDGSDFFTVNGYPRFTLVTESVKRLVQDKALTNCALVRSEELQWGSLSRPEDRYPPQE